MLRQKRHCFLSNYRHGHASSAVFGCETRPFIVQNATYYIAKCRVSPHKVPDFGVQNGAFCVIKGLFSPISTPFLLHTSDIVSVTYWRTGCCLCTHFLAFFTSSGLLFSYTPVFRGCEKAGRKQMYVISDIVISRCHTPRTSLSFAAKQP